MTIGQRIERSRAGQAVLSTLMVVVIVCVVAWNLPADRVPDGVATVTDPVTQALGLEQDWALFAPDPRAYSVGVYARVTRRDGRVVIWTPPQGGLALAPYRTYRWQKYVERLRADDYSALWRPTAEWVARQVGGRVRTVVLVRTFRYTVTPGSGAARGSTRQFAFYTLQLP